MHQLKQFLRRLFLYFLLTLAACLISGLFGILHDQISYTLSSEYFTLFKFPQFGLLNTELSDRVKAGIVGFLASWWMGIAIGLVAFAPCFSSCETKEKIRKTMVAFLMVACITALFSAIGIWLGSYNTKAHPQMFDDWYVPAETRNVRQFLIVGSMHNMTYLGGATGMIAVLSWQIFDWIKQRFFSKQPMSLPTP